VEAMIAFPGVKWPWLAADLSPPFSAKVKNEYMPQVNLMFIGPCLIVVVEE